MGIFRSAVAPRVLLTVIVSTIGGWTALADRNMTLDDPNFWALTASMLVCGVITWGLIAFDNSSKDKEANRLQATLDGLLKQITPVDPGSLKNWRSAANSELKREVALLAANMRAFGNRIRQERIPVSHFLTISDGDQRQAARQDENNRRAAQSAGHTDDFNAQFRPAALALRDEMRRRLGEGPPPHASQDSVALEYGMLAGVNPVDEAALELERLAQKLPD
ncbi:MAG: hypothetical protein WC803_00470 [Sphingomonas sp.]|jgi:hypothetical protein